MTGSSAKNLIATTARRLAASALIAWFDHMICTLCNQLGEGRRLEMVVEA